MEMAALHPRYFEASPHVLEKLGLSEDDKFAIVRFVGETAWHDLGKKKMKPAEKVQLVRKLQSFGKVFISTESSLPEELRPLKLDIEPHEMHHLLSYASLVAGNGATLAAEAAVLGTPAVYISDLRPGYLDYLEKQYGLVMNFGVGEKDFQMAVKTAGTLIGRPGGKGNALRQAEKLQADHLDVTRFMMETVEGLHE